MFLKNFNIVIGRLKIEIKHENIFVNQLYDRLDVFAFKFLFINTCINMSDIFFFIE